MPIARLPGLGHYPQIEDPAATLAVIERIVSEAAGPGPVGERRWSGVSAGRDALGALVSDRPHRGRHERGAGDHEAERHHPGSDPDDA